MENGILFYVEIAELLEWVQWRENGEKWKLICYEC